jgi:hypothetical protein
MTELAILPTRDQETRKRETHLLLLRHSGDLSQSEWSALIAAYLYPSLRDKRHAKG